MIASIKGEDHIKIIYLLWTVYNTFGNLIVFNSCKKKKKIFERFNINAYCYDELDNIKYK